jgi:hypothetical protein
MACIFEVVKGKVIPVTGPGGPQGCETSRRTHFLDSRLRDVSEVFRLTRQEDSLYSLMLEAESTPRAIARLEALGQLKNFSDLIGNRTFDPAACLIVPQPTMLRGGVVCNLLPIFRRNLSPPS